MNVDLEIRFARSGTPLVALRSVKQRISAALTIDRENVVTNITFSLSQRAIFVSFFFFFLFGGGHRAFTKLGRITLMVARIASIRLICMQNRDIKFLTVCSRIEGPTVNAPRRGEC